MNRLNLNKILKLTSVGLFINVLLFLINKNSIMHTSNSIENLIIISYSSLGTSIRELIVTIISNTINCIFLTYIFCDYITNDINKNGQYLFTRSPNRKKWLLSKYKYIYIHIFIYYICIYIAFLFLALSSGFQIYTLDNFFILIFSQFFINVLVTIFSITFVTELSFKISPLYSFSIFYSCYITNLILLFFFKNNLLGSFFAFTPFGLSILRWNGSINTLLASNIDSFSTTIINLNIFFICLLFVIFIFIFLVIQIKSLNNKDIL